MEHWTVLNSQGNSKLSIPKFWTDTKQSLKRERLHAAAPEMLDILTIIYNFKQGDELETADYERIEQLIKG